MDTNQFIILAGIVLTSVSLGYMLRLCGEIREIAKQGIDNKLKG